MRDEWAQVEWEEFTNYGIDPFDEDEPPPPDLHIVPPRRLRSNK